MAQTLESTVERRDVQRTGSDSLPLRCRSWNWLGPRFGASKDNREVRSSPDRLCRDLHRQAAPAATEGDPAEGRRADRRGDDSPSASVSLRTFTGRTSPGRGIKPAAFSQWE